jgi:outer membrane protein
MTQKQTELGKMDTAIQALKDELEKQSSVLSPDARDKKQLEITQKTRQRNAFLEDGQAEINRMREKASQQAQQITQEFRLKVRPIIEAAAKEKGFDVVIDSQFAYTVNRDFDITAQVIARAEAPAASAEPATAAPKP